MSRDDGGQTEGTTAETRRRYLAAVGAGAASLLAGCGGGGDDGTTTEGAPTATGTDPATSTPAPEGSVLTAMPSGPCQQPPTATETTYEGPTSIREDTTLGSDADVVRVDNLLSVSAGTTLTVAPGTTLAFARRGQLRVDGTLSAEGTCAEPIVMTGQADGRGAWGGLTFAGRGAGTLDHVLVEDGGGEDGAGVEIRSTAPVRVRRSEVRGSRNVGVEVADRARLETFAGNGLTDNAEPLATTASQVGSIAPDNVLTGNDTDRVRVRAGTDNTLPEDEAQTWADPGVPLYLTQGRGTFQVRGELTLTPGLELRFAQDNGLFVEGSLNAALPDGAIGEGPMATPPAEAVLLRGAQATPGFWEGVMYSGTEATANVLSGVVIRHAGGEPAGRGIAQEPAAVSVLQGARLTLDGALIEENGGYGLFVNRENRLQTIRRARVRNNGAPAALYVGTVPRLGTTADYTGNGSEAVEVVTPSDTIEEGLTVPALDVPYRIGRSSVGSLLELRAPVTVADGAELRFEDDAGIDVLDGGSLRVEGSETGEASRSTVLRGVEATPGFWKGVRYFDTRSGENVIDGVEIRHTGSSEWSNIASPARAAVAAAVGAEATVRNSVVAAFEGEAFRASEDRPPAGDQSSTIDTSNNVVR